MNAGREAIDRVAGQGEGLVIGCKALNGHHRPEHLLPHDLRFRSGGRDQRRA